MYIEYLFPYARGGLLKDCRVCPRGVVNQLEDEKNVAVECHSGYWYAAERLRFSRLYAGSGGLYMVLAAGYSHVTCIMSSQAAAAWQRLPHPVTVCAFDQRHMNRSVMFCVVTYRMNFA